MRRNNRIPSKKELVLATMDAMKSFGGKATTQSINQRVADILNIPDEVLQLEDEVATLKEKHTVYPEFISDRLTPFIDESLPLVLDLFAGCGGLSLGFEANGFSTIGYEMNENAVRTYNENLIGNCIQKKLEIGEDYPQANIIIGGPPCQPFSVRGKQSGLDDSRDGFPIFLDAVERISPDLCLFENVRGMLFRNKHYLDEILYRLDKYGYFVYFALLNAKYYEVPQNRERVIVVGSKKTFSFPSKGRVSFTAGDAVYDLIDQEVEDRLFLTKSMDDYIKRYEIASKCINPRDLHLDRPARTLTCRNLAGSTSDMHRIKLQNNKRRRLTIHEAARLQSFPDWFVFHGSEFEIFQQIGNAVAPMFAYHIAKQIKKYIHNNGLNENGNKYIREQELFDEC